MPVLKLTRFGSSDPVYVATCKIEGIEPNFPDGAIVMVSVLSGPGWRLIRVVEAPETIHTMIAEASRPKLRLVWSR